MDEIAWDSDEEINDEGWEILITSSPTATTTPKTIIECADAEKPFAVGDLTCSGTTCAKLQFKKTDDGACRISHMPATDADPKTYLKDEEALIATVGLDANTDIDIGIQYVDTEEHFDLLQIQGGDKWVDLSLTDNEYNCNNRTFETTSLTGCAAKDRPSGLSLTTANYAFEAGKRIETLTSSEEQQVEIGWESDASQQYTGWVLVMRKKPVPTTTTTEAARQLQQANTEQKKQLVTEIDALLTLKLKVI